MKTNKSKCKHKELESDELEDYEYNKEIAKVVIPFYCMNCNYSKVIVYYYKFKSYQSIPDSDYIHNTLRFTEFTELDEQEIEINYEKLEDDITVQFNCGSNQLGPDDLVKLYITYEFVKKEEKIPIEEIELKRPKKIRKKLIELEKLGIVMSVKGSSKKHETKTIIEFSIKKDNKIFGQVIDIILSIASEISLCIIEDKYNGVYKIEED